MIWSGHDVDNDWTDIRVPVSYQFDIGSHFCDLTHLYHDKLVDLRIFLFVIAHIVQSKQSSQRVLEITYLM